MDVETLKNQIDGHIARVTDPAKRSDLRTRADTLYAQHQAAATAAEKTQLFARLEAVRAEAETAASTQNTSGGGSGGGNAAAGMAAAAAAAGTQVPTS